MMSNFLAGFQAKYRRHSAHQYSIVATLGACVVTTVWFYLITVELCNQPKLCVNHVKWSSLDHTRAT